MIRSFRVVSFRDRVSLGFHTSDGVASGIKRDHEMGGLYFNLTPSKPSWDDTDPRQPTHPQLEDRLP